MNTDTTLAPEKIKKPKLVKPSLFQVLLLNDDYTTMEFVVKVLMKFFGKSEAQAGAIMLKIHKNGEAVCGTYSYDIAQTKVEQVISFSRENDHPLMCVLRKEY
jgi:ATP-dependent Clp protease adaptor protein ClpS